jgi:anti-sigma regulatory factor (Ser/Thr protein kinase)
MLRMSSALPRTVEAPARARRLCERACREWGFDRLHDVCALLVSELVTNAVLHGTGAVEVELRSEGACLHVGVRQFDRVLELPDVHMSGPDAVRGRGLAMVERLAADWGAEVAPQGSTVWFELRRAPDRIAGDLG